MPELSYTKKSIIQKFPSIKKPDILALFLCMGMFFFWLNLLIGKFVHFGYYDWDLAMYAQAVWALTQGSLSSSLFGTSFLTNHTEYLAFFLAPFYKIFPGAFTLIVFKILAFTTGAFVFYLITKRLLGWKLGIVFLLMYFIHPANLFMLIYEFHFENLAIPFIFLMYYFFLQQRLFPFLISAVFATLVKENISLIVLMFGIYALFQKKDLKSGWVIGPAILGGLFFVFNVFIMMPHVRIMEGLASSNLYIDMYQNSPLWHNMTSPIAQRYAYDLLLPFNILPLLSPLTLFLGLPIFSQHFLSPNPGMQTFYYHYAATAIIFVFLAAVHSLEKVRAKAGTYIYYGIIFFTILGITAETRNFLPDFRERMGFWQDSLDGARHNMVKQIPPDASIIASFDFLDKLVDRKELYSLHTLWRNNIPFTGRPFPTEKPIEFALIDWQSYWLWIDLKDSDQEKVNQYLKRLNEFYFSRQWGTVAAVQDTVLLSTVYGKATQPPLIENAQILFPGVTPAEFTLKVGEHLQLLSMEIPSLSVKAGDVLPFLFVWQSQKPTNDFIAIDLKILKNNRVIAKDRHALGYAFNATPLWKEGQYIKEYYNLLTPPFTPGEYTVNISFINLSNGNTETIFFKGQELKNISLTTCIQCPNPTHIKNLL